jgi:uncharacterized SAM-binding protein YcdF (DUF218 family)
MQFRELASAIATPLVFALLVGLVGGGYRIAGRRRIAAWLAASATIIAYAGATVPGGDLLLGPLERAYPPLRAHQPLPAVPYVVVLGSAYAPRDDIPVTSALDDEGLRRIVEGVRLVRQLPGARLIASGGARPGGVPAALGYALLARTFGVDPASIIVLDASLDTADEARAVAARIGATPFILVTSSFHMPRAVRLMQQAGAHPIPAPTGQRAGGAFRYDLRAWLPTSRGLRKSEAALHEYVGLAALAMRIG